MTDSEWSDTLSPTVVRAIRQSLSEASIMGPRVEYAFLEDFVYDGVAAILGARIREVSEAALTRGIREAIQRRVDARGGEE